MSKKISEYDDWSVLTGNELIEVVQSGGNYKGTLDALFSAPLWADRIIDVAGHNLTFTGGDIIFTDNIHLSGNGAQISLKSPDGTRWDITVDNSGSLVIAPD